MAQFEYGSVIQGLRRRKKFTQKQLCRGICDVSTLSRIERGTHSPSRFVYKALLERLGQDPQKTLFTSLDELDFFNGFYHLETLVMDRAYDEAETALEELLQRENMSLEQDSPYDLSEGSHLKRQILLNIKASIVLNKHKDIAGAEKLLTEAIRLTIPDYGEIDISHYPLTYEEIAALNALASAYDKAGDADRAIILLYGVKNSMDRFCADEYEKSRGYSQTLYNLSNLLGRAERYQEALIICETGIHCCQTHKRLWLLPNLNFNKAFVLFHMDKGNRAPYVSLVVDAYHALRNNGDLKDAETYREYGEKEMGIQFEY